MGQSNFVRKHILQACHSFMVPVARFLLRAGIGFREFEEICRLAFVEVASAEYGLRGRPTNVSRVSAMTGIARKDVARIRQSIAAYETDEKLRLSPLGDVLHCWFTNQKFQDSEGHPITLPYAGPEMSFEALVAECAGDLPAGALRSELVRYGAVAVEPEGKLRATRREVVPEDVDEKLITALSFNLACLADTIAYNTDPCRKGPVRIERFVQSGELNDHWKARLRSTVGERLVAFTQQLDDLFSGCGKGDERVRAQRVGVGVYYYEDPD